MGKMLKFGGDGLPSGRHTFYTTKDGAEIRAEVGHEVDADLVVNPQQFVDLKMASFSKTSKDTSVR